MSTRPVGRTVACVALVLLGAVAVRRSAVEAGRGRSASELAVSVVLPAATAPGDVARRWVVPIEARARGIGDVAFIDGEVSSDGARLRVTLRHGADASRKAARLTSEMEALRDRLPDGGRILVVPREGPAEDEVAVVALTGRPTPEEVQLVRERLADVPGVRSVEVFGGPRRRLTLTVRDVGTRRSTELTRDVERAIRSAGERRRLGEWSEGGRRLPIVAGAGPAGVPTDAPLTLGASTVRVGDIAAASEGLAPRTAEWRHDGAPAMGLLVRREHGRPLLRVDADLGREVRRLAAAGVDLRVVDRAAEPLLRMRDRLLRATGMAVAAALLFGALLAGIRGAIAFPGAVLVAVATALNASWLGRLPLEPTTVSALLVGMATGLGPLILRLLPGGGLRHGAWSCLFAAVLPVAVALGSEALGPALAAPAAAALLGTSSAALASVLVPLGPRRRGRWAAPGRALKALAREPATVVLGAATGAHVLLTLFGSALDPRVGGGPATRVLRARVSLPEGTSLEETVSSVQVAEGRLALVPGVRSTTGFLRPGSAVLDVELDPEVRGERESAEVWAGVTYALPHGLAAVRLEALEAAGGGVAVDRSQGSQPSTDPSARTYRFVVRGSDPEQVRSFLQRVLLFLQRMNVRSWEIRTDWGDPGSQVELVPRPERVARVDALAAGLRARSLAPQPFTVGSDPDGEVLVVASSGIEPGDDPPRLDALLGDALDVGGERLAPSAAFRVRDGSWLPALPREAGRFVLNVSVFLRFQAEDLRVRARTGIDRGLSRLPLPAGLTLERPSLEPAGITPERLRSLGLAALVPLGLLGLAAVRLNSIPWSLAALAPGLVGIALAAPVARWHGPGLALGTLLALAAVTCSTVALTTEWIERVRRGSGSPVLRAHRASRRLLPAAAWAAAIPATWLGGAAVGWVAEAPWEIALRVAGVAAAAGALAQATLLPVVALGLLGWAARDREQRLRARRPPAWSDPSEPVRLEARSVTKIYGDGFEALSAVSFDLGPGVVGLVGPNGAGKTTLMRLLTGLLLPTRGEIRYRGALVVPESLPAYRQDVGYLPQEFNAYPGLTGEQFLAYWAAERGGCSPTELRREVARLLDLVGLTGAAGRRVRDYSGGMRQRIGVARALIGRPRVLIVDEPTTGLDIESRDRFREVLLRIAEDRLVLLSTHLASDLEATAGRILVLEGGRLRFDGAPSELVERARGRVFEALVADRDLHEFSHRHRVTSRVRVRGGLRVRAVAPPGERVPGRPVTPGLEEAYLAEMDRARGAVGPVAAARRFGFLARWRREDAPQR